jgi:ADP-ribose pyrophosphatase YjhB (NUDIX family)
MFEKNSHCSYCGQPFDHDQPWPRTCAYCGNTSFLNPVPVSVILIPVDEGLLFVRRGIEPRKGRLALPGGYINFGESWQAAGAREVLEETGLVISPNEIRELRVHSAPDGTLLIFGAARPRTSASLPPLTPNGEVTERLILTSKQIAAIPRDEIAFPLHADVVEAFFRRDSTL